VVWKSNPDDKVEDPPLKNHIDGGRIFVFSIPEGGVLYTIIVNMLGSYDYIVAHSQSQISIRSSSEAARAPPSDGLTLRE
jgi:hypothetical protein